MQKAKKHISLEKKKTRVGYSFVTHWALGLLIFFLYPLICSIWYGFNNVEILAGAIKTKFVGLEYFKFILNEDPYYLNNLGKSVSMMFYSLPFIIAVSLIFAVLLNQSFKGRTIFRAIFFLPVIMTNSVVMNMLKSDFITMPLFSTGKEGVGIINYNEIITSLNVPSQIVPILVFLLSNTIQIIWSCGVQIVLFLAGLQNISPSFYEVSKIEGANKWEEFWYITVPSLRHIISLVLIYTMIELFASMDNLVVKNAYTKMISQDLGTSSAMLWLYFLIVIVLISIIYILYQFKCVKRWE